MIKTDKIESRLFRINSLVDVVDVIYRCLDDAKLLCLIAAPLSGDFQFCQSPLRFRKVTFRRSRLTKRALRRRECHNPRLNKSKKKSILELAVDCYTEAIVSQSYCSCSDSIFFNSSYEERVSLGIIYICGHQYAESNPVQIDEWDEPLSSEFLQETEYSNPSLIFYPNLPVALTPGRLSAAVTPNRPKGYSGPWSNCLLASHRFRIYISSDDDDHELYPNMRFLTIYKNRYCRRGAGMPFLYGSMH